VFFTPPSPISEQKQLQMNCQKENKTNDKNFDLPTETIIFANNSKCSRFEINARCICCKSNKKQRG